MAGGAAGARASGIAVALPETHDLRERLAAARRLGEAIREALPDPSSPAKPTRRKRDELAMLLDARPQEAAAAGAPSAAPSAAPTLEDLQALRARVAALGCQVPRADALAAALARLEAWAERARRLLRARSPLEDVAALAREGADLPAQMPELAALRAAQRRGEAWRAGMQALLAAPGTPLKRLRDALHAGLRLPVEMPEVLELRGAIRRREWEEQARRAVGGRGALHALREALVAADELGAADDELAVKIRCAERRAGCRPGTCVGTGAMGVVRAGVHWRMPQGVCDQNNIITVELDELFTTKLLLTPIFPTQQGKNRTGRGVVAGSRRHGVEDPKLPGAGPNSGQGCLSCRARRGRLAWPARARRAGLDGGGRHGDGGPHGAPRAAGRAPGGRSGLAGGGGGGLGRSARCGG
ncbi:hypothetical protein QBZ16_000315 [Prototheca wickerhamii]|uniref:Lysine-specific demethylase-like domain-containing protein n=1 Tax=Prototheca wickerhamii TaxID=3111 RepID=A0AAD9MJU3_PROWI|nr:hypothetical protein QBZ16_000315 [Prototheca wickerhamii]